jgi:hypothetical protein
MHLMFDVRRRDAQTLAVVAIDMQSSTNESYECALSDEGMVQFPSAVGKVMFAEATLPRLYEQLKRICVTRSTEEDGANMLLVASNAVDDNVSLAGVVGAASDDTLLAACATPGEQNQHRRASAGLVLPAVQAAAQDSAEEDDGI